MSTPARPRILCVDDDANVLEAIGRHLRREAHVFTALRGEQALRLIEGPEPFQVIVADCQMPGMNGIELLERCRASVPDTVRILLTGQADMEAAMAAVNAGSIFRFLWKPCPVTELRKALEAAVRQYQLVTSERVLLEETLRGCIRALTDILALASPAAFGRGMRVRAYVTEVADALAVGDRWLLEVTAMLSQIGSVTLPADTQDKHYHGKVLSAEEEDMVARVPAAAAQLLGRIPRLEPVQEILRYQEKNFDGSGLPVDDVIGEDIPWGARMLKIAVHYDVLEMQGLAPAVALETLRGRVGAYDSQLLEVFRQRRGEPRPRHAVREVSLAGLASGMVFAEDVWTLGGVFLIARGQAITPGLLLRLHNMAQRGSLQPLFRVALEAAPAEGTDAHQRAGAEEVVS